MSPLEAIILAFSLPVVAILITGFAIKFFAWILKDEQK